jgi:predicted nucleic acid-binding protein
MRRYLIDTGPLSALLYARPKAVNLITPWITSGEAATSMLVYGEVTEYIRGLPDYTRYQTALRNLLRGVYPFQLTYPILERYAEIRRQLRPPYGRGLIGDMDTLIAATAMERNLTVVTTDSDYERVPGLQVMIVKVK